MSSPSNRPPRSPLTRRYAVRLCGLTLFLLLVSGLIEMYFAYRESQARIEESQALQAEAAAREIEAFVAAIQSGLQAVARLPWGNAGFDASLRKEEFYRLMQRVPAIIELQAANAQGQELLLVSRSKLVREQSGQELPPGAAALAGQATAVQFGPTSFIEEKFPTMWVSVPDSLGTTCATVDLRLLGEVVSRFRTEAGRASYIVDAKGLLIAHSRATEVLGKRNLARMAPVSQTLRQPTGALGVSAVATEDVLGNPVIATSAKVPGPNWTVVIEQQRAEALAPVWAALGRTLALMLVGGSAATVLGIAFARNMAAPILRLRESTARVITGRLEFDRFVRPSARPSDEIEDLTDDFSEMVLRLREMYEGLEAKVAERTAELSLARDTLAERGQEVESLNRQLVSRLDELSLRKDEAERANAAKTRFLAAASHDLRQPMHSISLLMGVLRSRLQEPSQAELAEKVQTSVATMESLFGNLLDISKLDAGAVQTHLEPIDLRWLLTRVAHTWAPQAAEKGLSLRVRSGPLSVRGDVTLLERILGNLVANAIRYTRSGGVLLACRRRGAQVVVEVWDTGPGIAPQHRQAIFEEFYRIEAPGTGSEKGLGLGLSIVQRCAQLLGYGVSLESRLGRGTVFRVAMPLAVTDTLSPAQSGLAAVDASALAGNFIAVVDDDETNRLALRDALLGWRCHVVVAASREALLSALSEHLRGPDLLVTDYQLGDGDNGLALISAVRQELDPALPALIVTANTDVELQGQSQALGVGLLHKPVGLQKLLEAMLARLPAPQS